MNQNFLPIREALSVIMQNKRVQAGLSIDELLEKISSVDINMSKKTYERIENGNYYPTLEQFFMILKALECSVSINGETIM